MADVNYALSALGAVATARGTSGGYVPDNAIDGNDLTYWQTGGYTPDQWWQVDLGAPQFLTSLDLLQSSDPNHAATAMTISYGLATATEHSFGLVTVSPGANQIDLGGLWLRYLRVDTGTLNTKYWIILTAALMGPAEAPPNPVTPMCDQITAWLDAIEDNFVPCVEDWLEANP